MNDAAEEWVRCLSARELPVLRHTARRLDEARARLDRLSAGDIAKIVCQDPFLAARTLLYIQPLTSRRLHNDVTTIAGAITMMGVEPFFHKFDNLPLLEDAFQEAPKDALLRLLKVVRRARQASHFARDWALWRVDVNVEEVALAALLYDLAEMLIYAFFPTRAYHIYRLRLANPHVRSATIQNKVLGCTGSDIQQTLCRQWKFPALFQALYANEHANSPRVKNVVLAVSLARHLAHEGWRDRALPEDLREIGELLNLSQDALGERLGLRPPDAEQLAEAT
ncbi:MAG: HDOD domain-containing protein [Zoogloeaceae bacterium]|jgi:HD-like signal output (HDOD) protein|nr:HDOD domain-containing protein [Zoogloeaceae bacterium]